MGGLLLGPLMPLDVSAATPQTLVNWVVRLLLFSSIGYVVGFISDVYKQELKLSKESSRELLESRYATIFSIVKLSESRDDYTGTHIERIAEMSKIITAKLRETSYFEDYIDEEYIDIMYRATYLHDIGKVGIPDNVLLKKGKLDDDEFEIVKRHTTIGWAPLKKIKEKHPSKFIEFGMNISRHHHEKWDGTGYPDGLSGRNIPLKARIAAIVDVYDALRLERPYKEGYSHIKAINIIKDGRASHFDPFITDIFMENNEVIEKIYDSYVQDDFVESWTME